MRAIENTARAAKGGLAIAGNKGAALIDLALAPLRSVMPLLQHCHAIAGRRSP